MILSIVIIIIGLLGTAFFAGTETALIALLRDKKRLENLPSSISRWLDMPENIFSVTLIGTNISIIVASSISAALFIRFFGEIGGVYSLITISIISLIFCEVLPKSRALSAPESFAMFASKPFNLSAMLLKPASSVTNALSGAVVKIVHRIVKPAPPPDWSDLELVTRKGKIDLGSSRNALLLLIFEFANRTAFDIMLPRTEFTVVSADTPLPRVVEFAKRRKVGRLIVESELGEIEGAVDTRDLISGKYSILKDAITEPFFVPEGTSVINLFAEMDDSDTDFAFVVDEHGSVTGGVSFESLIDFLSGVPRGSRRAICGRTATGYIVDGFLNIEQLESIIQTEIPQGPYKTIAGFIEELNHNIPAEGETVYWNNWSFLVLKRNPRSILKIRIEPVQDKYQKPA